MGDANHIHGSSAYRPEFALVAEELAEAGASNVEIAAHLGVNRRTLIRWRRQYPSIAHAIIRGRDRAKALGARAIYERAIGFSAVTDKLVDGVRGPTVRRVTEYHPPDPLAARLWMQRRRAGDTSAELSALNGEQGQ